MKKFICLLGISVVLLSCNREGGSLSESSRPDEKGNRYATGFKVEEGEGYRLLTVYDPWQQSKGLKFSYLLTEKGSVIPDSLQDLPRIKLPVTRLIPMSTTHCAMISALGQQDRIVAVSGGKYLYQPDLVEALHSGAISDIGYGRSIDFEAIIGLEPELMILYGVNAGDRELGDRLSELGIPYVYCGEYLESHPLGKAEWVRFFASLLGIEDQGNALFDAIAERYESMAKLAENTAFKPRVLTGLPWKDSWYIAGGQSYVARLIQDAGGSYLWSKLEGSEAVPIDIEHIFLKAMEADFWLNTGTATSLDEISGMDERFKLLPPFKSGRVINNNRRMGPAGGNDYWESGVVRPDDVLADLIHFLHPELLPEHQALYYQQLK